MPIVVTTPQATQQVPSVDWADITNKPSTFPPAPHGPTHPSSSTDPVPNVSATGSGLVPVLPAGTPFSKYLAGDGTWHDVPTLVTPTSMGLVPALPSDPAKFFNGIGAYAAVDYTQVANKPATFPSDWNTTTNKPATFPSDWNTTVNKPASFTPSTHGATHTDVGTDPVPVATSSATGLMPRLTGSTGQFLNGQGLWSVPQGAGDMLRAVYDTNGDNIVDHASLADSVPWGGVSGKPATFPPSAHAPTHNLGGSDPVSPDWTQIQNKPATFPGAAHASTHLDNGTDVIPVVTTTRTGLAPKLSGSATTFLDGTGAFSTPSGLGDMTKAVYDVNGDGIVDQAAAVPWTGVTGKPTSFTPSAHAATHVTGGSDTIANASGSSAGLLRAISGKSTDFLDGTHSWQDLTSAVSLVRLRSFNALGNPNAEVDQRNAGNGVNMAAGNVSVWACDRWLGVKNAATMNTSVGQTAPTPILIPGTNFAISSRAFYMQLNTQQASLAAGEYLQIYQQVEGPRLRELISGVHSISILAWCNNALTFTIYLRAPGTPLYTLTKTCVLPANTWTLFTLPNLPVWTPSATWSLTPGASGYLFGIGLGAGTTYTSPANDTWQSGNFVCGPGTTNFGSLPTGTAFQVAFVQHEPGPFCTTFIDKPFSQNLDECLRYYEKSYLYGIKGGAVSSAGAIGGVTLGGAHPFHPIRFHKPMVTTPTVIPYSSQTGAGSAVYDANAASDRSVSSVNTPGDTGYSGLALATLNSAATNYYWQHVADTSW